MSVHCNSPWINTPPQGYKTVRLRRGDLFNPEPETAMERLRIGGKAASQLRDIVIRKASRFPDDAILSIGRPESTGTFSITATPETIEQLLTELPDIEVFCE